MIFTKWFTGSGPRQILCMLLALAVLGTAAGVLVSTLTPDGEDVSIEEVWEQGVIDGLDDGANFWWGHNLEVRLKQHHYNDEQRLTYTNGYNFGYQLVKM